VPEEWLNADIKQGISNSDVEHRRKRFGWNEITTEKENLFIKFLMFFTGPILYGKYPTASHSYPVLPSRVLRRQWLLQSHCFCFSRAPPQLLELRAQKAWRAFALQRQDHSS
jgi:hypothetical protein